MEELKQTLGVEDDSDDENDEGEEDIEGNAGDKKEEFGGKDELKVKLLPSEEY